MHELCGKEQDPKEAMFGQLNILSNIFAEAMIKIEAIILLAL